MTQAIRRGALLLLLGAGLAACGPADSSTSSSTSSQDDPANAAVKYSQCMREHGVPEFPDPVNGRLQLEVRKGGTLDPESASFKAAQTACKDLEPPGLAQSGQGGAQQEDMLKYVDCMRKNGVPKFPDPQPDGRMLFDGGSGVDPDSPQFKAAQEACRKLLPGGVAPGGQ